MNETLSPAMHKLNEAFLQRGFHLWLVGGAVRDSVMGIAPKDFDFATDATPDEQIRIYDDAGYRYVPTGIKHGTLTAIVDDELFEVTTLRLEANHDGRYADMTFTRTLEADLARRDLTINAMAMDFDGNIIDPFGGRDDLTARRVRFVGNPDDRMREDYLRILRWLRFHARIAGDAALDPETVAAAKRQAAGLKQISRERVWSEIGKLLGYEHGWRLLEPMWTMDVCEFIDLPQGDYGEIGFVAGNGVRDPVTALAAFFRKRPGVVARLAEDWKWSAADTRKAQAMLRLFEIETVDETKERIFLKEEDQAHAIEAADARGRAAMAKALREWVVPAFPLTGEDFLAAGFTRGKSLGEAMHRLRVAFARWGYDKTREEMLDVLAQEKSAWDAMNKAMNG